MPNSQTNSAISSSALSSGQYSPDTAEQRQESSKKISQGSKHFLISDQSDKSEDQKNAADPSGKSFRSLSKIDFAVGGQALIEGVMMRSPHFITAAVRKSKGDITIRQENFCGITMKIRFLGIPLLRGIINMFEMMIVGMRMLNFSASEALDEEAITTKTVHNEEKTGNSKKETANKTEKTAGKWQGIMSVVSFVSSLVFAFGMTLFLFKFLPLWLTEFLSKNYSVLQNNYFIFNAVDGLIKITFFVTYIGLIGLAPALKRVFQYHGAEHKSIYTYEEGLELTVENAKKQTRFHPRCGTSFIIVVFMISIFIYTFVPKQEEFFMNFLARVSFLPFIAGISYEILKWSARQKRSLFIKILTAPGLWFQRLTTKEPDDKQLEVALEALKKALILEEEHTILQIKTLPQNA